MRSSKTLHGIAAHAEGEVGDVMIGGIAPPPAETLREQSRWIAQHQPLRNFVLNQSRGGVFRNVSLFVPPKDPRPGRPYHHGARGHAADVAVELHLRRNRAARRRRPPLQEPMTELVLQAPGRLVRVRAECRNGKAERISVQNLPSFAQRLAAPLEVEGWARSRSVWPMAATASSSWTRRR